MKKTLLVIVIGVMSLTLFAQSRNCKMGKEMNHGKMGNMECFTEELKLTETQQEQMHNIHLDHEKEMIKLRADLETLRIDKREAMDKENFSKAKSLTKQMTKLRESKALKQIEMREKVSKILTDEQKEIMKKKCMERPGMRKGMHSKRDNGQRRHQEHRRMDCDRD